MDFPEEISHDIISQLSIEDISSLGLVVRGNALHDRVWNNKLADLGYSPVSMAQGMWFLVNTNRTPEEQFTDIVNTGLESFFDSFVHRWPDTVDNFFKNVDNVAFRVDSYSPSIIERLRAFLEKDHSLIIGALYTDVFNDDLDFRRIVIDAAADFLSDEEVTRLLSGKNGDHAQLMLAQAEIAVRRGKEFTLNYDDMDNFEECDEFAYKLITGQLTPRSIEKLPPTYRKQLLSNLIEEYEAIGKMQAKSHDDKILFSYLSVLQAIGSDEDVSSFLGKHLEDMVEHQQLRSALFLRTMTIEYLTRLITVARQQDSTVVVKLVKMMDYEGQDAVTLTNTSVPNPFNHAFTILTDVERSLHGGVLYRSARSKYRLGF